MAQLLSEARAHGIMPDHVGKLMQAYEAEKQQDKGLASESLTARYKEVLEEMKRREQSLSERETQVTTQLEAERANLTDLNKRLDALEMEMMITSHTDETKERVKR